MLCTHMLVVKLNSFLFNLQAMLYPTCAWLLPEYKKTFSNLVETDLPVL